MTLNWSQYLHNLRISLIRVNFQQISIGETLMGPIIAVEHSIRKILMCADRVGLKLRQVWLDFNIRKFTVSNRIRRCAYWQIHNCNQRKNSISIVSTKFVELQFKVRWYISYFSLYLTTFLSRTSGGSCNGGDHVQAYSFIHKYGISDDTCSPFVGLNWLRGFEVAAMTDVEEVQDHMCYNCNWNGACEYLPK